VYVANSQDATVSIVDPGTEAVTGTINVAVEPMALVFSPNGSRLYVAAAASNVLQVIDTSTSEILSTVDLSSFGTSPRAIAVTNDGDGDDTDETIFVPLFFAQLRSGKTFVDEGQDDQREGRVAAISAATNVLLGSPNPITLGPMTATGFNSNGQLAPGPDQVPAVPSTNPQTFTTPTGAFPNQLASVAIHPTTGRAYVVSTGASPNGPLRFNSNVQGVVSVFDSATRSEITAAQTGSNVRQTAPLNLNQGINLSTTPSPRFFMSNPVAVAWRPDGSDAWAAIQTSDLLVRLTADADGVPSIGAPLVAGPSQIVRLDLDSSPSPLPFKAPRGIAINGAGTRLFVSNFVSRSVAVVDISNPNAPSIVSEVASSALPSGIGFEALIGGAFFRAGRGPDDRMSSEGWGACIACHPDGLSDNVTWMFDAGPRQTIPLDGTFAESNPNDQRILNWSATRDEVHDFELNTRNVFGGRGLIDDDRLFLAIGGASGTTPTESTQIEQFHQATGAVGSGNSLVTGTAFPSLPGGRRDFGIATLDPANDGRVFIIGGRTGAGQGSLVTGDDTVLEFDPRTNVLVSRSSVGFTPRHSLGAAAVKTSEGVRIYAIGGYASTTDTANPVDTVEEYDPTDDSWRTVASLPSGVAQFGITVSGGINTAEPVQLIHAVSGNKGSESTPALQDSSTFTVQRFQADPAGPGSWTTLNPSVPVSLTARRNHGAATALRGAQSRVFVIGGQDASGNVLDSVEEYQAQAGTVVDGPHTDLPAPRARFGIGSSLSTNQVYVVGGVDDAGADQSTIFEYSIAANGPAAGPAGTPSGVWVTRGNLSAVRSGLGLTTPPGVTSLLPNANAGRPGSQGAIATWVALNVRPRHAPVLADDALAVAGRALFEQEGLVEAGFSCATCHGGPKWTRSIVDYAPPPSPETGLDLGNERVIGTELRQTLTQGPDPDQVPGVLIDVGTFTLADGRTNELRANSADVSQAIRPLGANGFNIPSLLSAHETAPYFYSGLAQTLEEVLNGAHDDHGGTRHHFVQNASDRARLIAFLRSIDETVPAPGEEPTPSPTATTTVAATATPTRTATVTPIPSVTPTPTRTELGTATPTRTRTATIVPSTTPTRTPTTAPTATATRAATRIPPSIECLGKRATIIGTGGDDVIVGTDGPDVIVGRRGNDDIRGKDGKDTICSGMGNDTVRGGGGGDQIAGGAGNDVLRGGSGNDALEGGPGRDVCTGGSGRDSLSGCE
jgi:YVTN family beta-propeller protein